MDISNRLKERRVEVGLKQTDVAEALGVSRQTISNWENGRSLPDLKSVVTLSDLYSISLDDMLKGDQKMMNKLIKDTDVKKSNDRLNILSTFLVLVSGGTLFSMQGKNLPLLLILSIGLVNLALVLLVVKQIIEHTRLVSDYQTKNSEQAAEKSVKTVTLLIFSVIVIGIVLGFLAGFLG